MAFLVAAFLLAPGALRGADAGPPAAVASIALKDGRILHNVRVMSEEADSIVVRADEGLIKIAKSDLPKEAAGAYPAKQVAPAGPEFVMQPFNPNQVVEAPGPEPGAKPIPKPVPKPADAPAPGANPVFKGCSIISFQMKAFQTQEGCAEVVIHNDTDAMVEIRPGDIVCVTAAGARHAGRFIVTEAFPPSIKRREFVPPHGDIDDIVTFTNEALDISSVQWAK
jgi:hypothetical protein